MKRLITRLTLAAYTVAGSAVAACGQNISLPQTIYSQVFYGDSSGHYVNASCGSSMNPVNCSVAMNGQDSVPILVNPWAGVPIHIRCEQVVVIPQGASLAVGDYAFGGNSFSPDTVAWGMARDGVIDTGKSCYPGDVGMPFPAGNASNAPGQNNFAAAHLDLHVMSPTADNVPFQAYLIVWYTKDSEASQ